MPNIITPSKKTELLRLDKKDLGASFITKKFTGYATQTIDASGKRKFVTYPPYFNIRDIVVLEAGEYINTEKIQTNVGRILFNKLVIEETIQSVIPGGFYNKVFTMKSWGEIA